jgi:hypothetical protein
MTDDPVVELDEATREALWRSLGALDLGTLQRLAGELYGELAREHPAAAATFGRLDLAAQAGKLSATLVTMSACAHDRPRLGAEAIRLGALHARFEIGRDDYLAFAAILAALLARRQSVVPPDAARRFWEDELGAIIEVMLAVAG